MRQPDHQQHSSRVYQIYQHLPIHPQKTIPMWANKLELDGAVVNHAGRSTPLLQVETTNQLTLR